MLRTPRSRCAAVAVKGLAKSMLQFKVAIYSLAPKWFLCKIRDVNENNIKQEPPNFARVVVMETVD